MALMMSLIDSVQHVISHDSSDDNHNSDGSSRGFGLLRRNVPFIASPLDPKTAQWLSRKTAQSNLTLKRRPTVAQSEAERVADGIFRKQTEASPLELFFDLFFVANLAVFNFNHEQVSGPTVASYIGFVSILWTFWFHVSLHDVRFYVDSVLNRFFKFSQFAVFAAFTGLNPIYTVLSDDEGQTRAFSGIALVLMLSRLVLMLQYMVVLWFVRPFKKTLVPLSLMILVYFLSAMGFLGTYIHGGVTSLHGSEEASNVYAWYIIICVEAVLVIVISSIWRVLSFKRTHLVERVGLLTLIIMGEGIIGAVLSVSFILAGTTVSVWDATGRVIVGVLMIYLLFVLYFTPIAHDRFGTIRQQIWVLLHFPLHIAILLTEEGSAATLLWTTCISARERLIAALPSLHEPSKGYETLQELTSKINETMTFTAEVDTYLDLNSIYNWTADLTKIAEIHSEYASEEWNEEAAEILGEMVNETSNFFFENFRFEGPSTIETITDTNERLQAYFDSMQVIFTYFYIGAGCILLVMAMMYWIGKNNKTKEEWLALATRFVVGLALPFVCISAYYQPGETGFMYQESGWIVSVVLFCYLFVVTVDNVIASFWHRKVKQLSREGRLEDGPTSDAHTRAYHGAFGPHASADGIPAAVEKSLHPHKPQHGPVHFEGPASDHDRNSSRSDSQVDTLVGGRQHKSSNGESQPRPYHSSQSPPSDRYYTNNQASHGRNQSIDEDGNDPQSPPRQTYLGQHPGLARIDTGYRTAGGAESQNMMTSHNHDRDYDEEEDDQSQPQPQRQTSPRLQLPEQGHHRPEEERAR